MSEPRFIRQYLPNGDYNLVKNPNYDGFRTPERRTKQKNTTWTYLQKYQPREVFKKRKRPNKNSINYYQSPQILSLKSFKESIEHLNKQDKLIALRKKADEKVYNHESYASRRKTHERTRKQYFIKWKRCFVCLEAKTEHIHHMIQVQNGGSNHHSNLISVCHACHAEIHPWIKQDSLSKEYLEVTRN